MEVLCGIDIVDICRIKRFVDKRKEESLLKVFTENEINSCSKSGTNYGEKYAGRFAVKEAVLKIFGIGLFNGIPLNNIEILNNNEGKPYLNLKDKALRLYIEKKIVSIDISISHTATTAVAFAVALKL